MRVSARRWITGAVARQRLRAEFGCMTNGSDASQRQPVSATNLTAEVTAVATCKALQEVVPFVDHRRQPIVHRVTRMPQADEDQGRGDAAASAPVCRYRPATGGELHSHSASVSEASRGVCMTVGAQWPILNRFDMLRRRSVRVETLVKSPTRVRGIVGEGTGAVFVELVLPIAAPYPRQTSELETQGIRPFQVAAPCGVVRAVDGVEVLALDRLDSRIRQRELVNHRAHGVAEARVVRRV